MPSGAQTSKPCRPRLATYIAVSARASSSDAVAAVVGAQRDADARVDVQRHAVELERVAERGAEAVGDLPGARVVGVRQQDGELVATHAGQQVAGRAGPAAGAGPTRHSRSSPTLWPKLSLISLNRSRSIIRTAQLRPPAP